MTGPQRRHEPRVVGGGRKGLLRGCFPVSLLDLSEGGIQVETQATIRPGACYEFTADLDGRGFSAEVLIRRCTVTSTVADGNGGRAIVYRAGGSFRELDAMQSEALQSFLANLDSMASISALFAESGCLSDPD